VENFEGKRLRMCVAGVLVDVVPVSREQEFHAGEKERRQPHPVGFKKQWVQETSGKKP
jgi:hypothetical protein